MTASSVWALMIPMPIITFVAFWFFPAAPGTKFPMTHFDFPYLFQSGLVTTLSITLAAFDLHTDEQRGKVWKWAICLSTAV